MKASGAPARVIVLGGTGMLGSMVARHLARDRGLEVTATARRASPDRPVTEVEWTEFDGIDDLKVVDGNGWVVNCVGVIKPFIHDDDPAEVENAIRVNSLLPHALARAAQGKARVIQIATDCVYSGTKGEYVESDPHDAIDVYGKSKSLGEVPSPDFFNIRASIVGPEAGRSRSLLEWFLGQPEGAQVSGYVNHRWNGITTLHFAKICHGIIAGNARPRSPQHLIPSDEVTKFQLLELFAEAFHRSDVVIEPVEAPTVVDRTLATDDSAANAALWELAGYERPPDVATMIGELAANS